MEASKKHPVLEAKPLLPAQATLGEGSLWNIETQQLYWVDIDGCVLHIYDPLTGADRQVPMPSAVSTVVPVAGGDVLLALQSGIHRLNLKTLQLTLLCNPIDSAAYRYNDGKCDPSGRFWVGSLTLSRAPGASVLYRLDGDGSLHGMLQGLTIPNGIVWTADRKTMYFIDTPTQQVDAFDYDDATGDIHNRRTAFKIPVEQGSPDGMSIDAEGALWIAMWGGSAVNRYDPHTGEVLLRVKVDAPHTSSCAFGGKDLKTLFITSAREDLSGQDLEDHPLSGDLFSVDVDVPGVPASFYQPV